jgi:hypothetical protein
VPGCNAFVIEVADPADQTEVQRGLASAHADEAARQVGAAEIAATAAALDVERAEQAITVAEAEQAPTREARQHLFSLIRAEALAEENRDATIRAAARARDAALVVSVAQPDDTTLRINVRTTDEAREDATVRAAATREAQQTAKNEADHVVNIVETTTKAPAATPAAITDLIAQIAVDRDTAEAAAADAKAMAQQAAAAAAQMRDPTAQASSGAPNVAIPQAAELARLADVARQHATVARSAASQARQDADYVAQVHEHAKAAVSPPNNGADAATVVEQDRRSAASGARYARAARAVAEARMTEAHNTGKLAKDLSAQVPRDAAVRDLPPSTDTGKKDRMRRRVVAAGAAGAVLLAGAAAYTVWRMPLHDSVGNCGSIPVAEVPRCAGDAGAIAAEGEHRLQAGKTDEGLRLLQVAAERREAHALFVLARLFDPTALPEDVGSVTANAGKAAEYYRDADAVGAKVATERKRLRDWLAARASGGDEGAARILKTYWGE